ncbi:hypothetical protein IX332_000535 [Porphyromonas levii]|uniref:hypothetical protein n=1 Tax=Porphyromonas levii TaxID=28114 RepID=UPI0004755C09|nr:hypothetical protein [Porphyromonas levii]MBR8729221.1 hypothetical protein [Porphyromonas levii]MBR8732312.1 hypothetical protein [Porphyromonas levii]MBR8763450.1 hypothetical protein [Porphyromonas levii]MBR8769492.1 hypothetical protein [Porphyromonas levii]MBR8773977.1 hypothetical protein [Porphyromonas levii]
MITTVEAVMESAIVVQGRVARDVKAREDLTIDLVVQKETLAIDPVVQKETLVIDPVVRKETLVIDLVPQGNLGKNKELQGRHSIGKGKRSQCTTNQVSREIR